MKMEQPWEEEIFPQPGKAPPKEPMPLIEKVAIGMFAAIGLGALALTYVLIAFSIALHNCSF